MKRSKRNISKAAVLLLILVMTFAAAMPAYADTIGASDLGITNKSDKYIMQGNSCEISFELESKTDTPIVYDQAILTFVKSSSVKVTNGNTGKVTLNKGDKADIRFTVSVGKYYETGGQSYYFTLKNGDETVYTSRYYNLYVEEFTSTGENRTNLISGVEIACETSPSDGFYKGRGNSLNFQVFNAGNNRLKNTVLKVDLPSGVSIDNGSDSENLGYINVGDKKNCSFDIFVSDDVVTGNYMFTANVSGSDENGSSQSFSKSFYIYVNGKDKADDEDEDGTESNPRLMVSNYSIGGTSVQAGQTFALSMDFTNTSNKTLRNIKINLGSDSFVPVGGSNSFYVEKIAAKETISRTVNMSVVPDASQRTTAMQVSMSYEDSKGSAYTADDTISIKVNQKTRLVVDDIIPPYEVYVGNQSVASLDFYNMGKTTLENLRINAEGNFDIWESNSYFVGNMSSGNSDSYSFYFVPYEVGPVEGKVVFTYDDVEGNAQVYEVPFTFEAMEMPVWDDPYIWDEPVEEGGSKVPTSLIIFLVVLVVLVGGAIAFFKIRKKRQAKKLEIEDAAFESAMDKEKKTESKQEE